MSDFDFAQDATQGRGASTSRISSSFTSIIVFGGMLTVILGFCVGGAGLYLVLSKQRGNENGNLAGTVFGKDDAEILKDRTDLVIAMNRQLAVLQESRFWTDKGFHGAPLDYLDAKERPAKKRVDELERKMKTRWGEKLQTQGKFPSGAKAKFDLLTEGTKSIVSEILEISHKAILLELQTEKSKIVAEVYAAKPLPPTKFFDRNAPGGERAYQEFIIRQAAQDELIKERPSEISRLSSGTTGPRPVS